MGILSEKSYFCALSVTFLRLWVHFKDWKVSFKAMLSGKTQWRLMSTFWHKMSGLRLVISNLYGDIVRKIIFLCPLHYIFEARVHFKDWKVSFKAMLSGKTQWRLMSTFWHKMSGLRLVISNLYGDIVRKIIFLCPLRYIFEARVHFKDWKVSFKAMLSGKTQWRLMSTFWHKMSGLGLVISNLYGDIVRKIIFLCPLRYIFEARVHFKDGRSPSRLC